MSVSIRPAVDSDGPAVAALIASVFAEYPGCPFVLDEFPELAAPQSHYAGKGGGLWVADAPDAGVVGSFGLSRVDDGPVFEIHKVYLARSFRGAGLAGRLYDLVVREAVARGGMALRLWTDTRFADGHRFYERRGFTRLPVVRYLADATHAWEYAYVRPLS